MLFYVFFYLFERKYDCGLECSVIPGIFCFIRKKACSRFHFSHNVNKFIRYTRAVDNGQYKIYFLKRSRSGRFQKKKNHFFMGQMYEMQILFFSKRPIVRLKQSNNGDMNGVAKSYFLMGLAMREALQFCSDAVLITNKKMYKLIVMEDTFLFKRLLTILKCIL